MKLISRLVSSEVDVVDIDSCVEECADDLVCPALRLLLPRTSEAALAQYTRGRRTHCVPHSFVQVSMKGFESWGERGTNNYLMKRSVGSSARPPHAQAGALVN